MCATLKRRASIGKPSSLWILSPYSHVKGSSTPPTLVVSNEDSFFCDRIYDRVKIEYLHIILLGSTLNNRREKY